MSCTRYILLKNVEVIINLVRILTKKVYDPMTKLYMELLSLSFQKFVNKNRILRMKKYYKINSIKIAFKTLFEFVYVLLKMMYT